MRNDVTLTEDDEGKNVVNAAGDTVGRVISVEHGTAHVDPDPGLTDALRSKLGWGDAADDHYQLDGSDVEAVADDAVRLSE